MEDGPTIGQMWLHVEEENKREIATHENIFAIDDRKAEVAIRARRHTMKRQLTGGEQRFAG